MNIVDALRAKAAKAVARQEELLALSTKENRNFTDAEQKEFDTLETEVVSTMKAIETAKANATRKAALANDVRQTPAAPPANGVVELVTERTNPNVEVARKLTGVELVGVCAWAAAKQKNSPSKSAMLHLEEAGFQSIADDCRKLADKLSREKTFNTITAGTGDNTIVTPLSSEFIETLRNESIFLSSGPVPIDLSYGSLDMAGGNAGATGTYTAEGADIGYTQMSTRKINLAAKHITAITAISNYNIAVSPFAIASLVGEDLAMGLMLGIDAAGLRGDGTGNNPAGVLTLVNAAHKFAVTAATGVAPTYAQIDTDAKLALSKIRSSNVPKRRRKWLMSNRTFTYLQFMRDGNGNLIYPGLSAPSPTWYDNIPVGLSEQIPSNLGAGTNESEIYLVDFGHVLMGEARALVLKSSAEASYKNAGGTLVSAFARDETVIRGLASHDFDMRHDKAAVVLTAVKWGA